MNEWFTVEELVESERFLRVHTLDNLPYKFIYNTVDLTISVYRDNTIDSFIFKVNREGLYFINPRMKEKLEIIFSQHQGNR